MEEGQKPTVIRLFPLQMVAFLTPLVDAKSIVTLKRIWDIVSVVKRCRKIILLGTHNMQAV